jgi:hypothetical protein
MFVAVVCVVFFCFCCQFICCGVCVVMLLRIDLSILWHTKTGPSCAYQSAVLLINTFSPDWCTSKRELIAEHKIRK